MVFNAMSGGAILVGILIALGTAFNWPKWTNYIWAALTLVWGILGAAGVL
ncbi:MAG: hypothetical protein AABW65_01270 [Nanoarchaeota archaeon]